MSSKLRKFAANATAAIVALRCMGGGARILRHIARSRMLRPELFPDFAYKDMKIRLFAHHYNVLAGGDVLTERAVEIPIALKWLKGKRKENVLEIGAVMPYYRRGGWEVCDPYDPHPAISIKGSLFDIDMHGRDVLSISTIEHVSNGDYGLERRREDTPSGALKKILGESKTALITFQAGYNRELDDFMLSRPCLGKDVETLFYMRGFEGNVWRLEPDITKIRDIPFGSSPAIGLVVIEKAGG